MKKCFIIKLYQFVILLNINSTMEYGLRGEPSGAATIYYDGQFHSLSSITLGYSRIHHGNSLIRNIKK